MVGGVARDGTRWRVGLIGWETGTGAAEGEADLGLSGRELLLVPPVVLGNCGRGLHLGLTSCSPGSPPGDGETVGKRRLRRFVVTVSCNSGSFTRSTKA